MSSQLVPTETVSNLPPWMMPQAPAPWMAPLPEVAPVPGPAQFEPMVPAAPGPEPVAVADAAPSVAQAPGPLPGPAN